jgi:hypothetical protein
MQGVNHISKLLVIIAVGILLAPPTVLSATRLQATAPSSAEAAAIKQFNEAIAKYMALRQRLRSEVAGPVKDSSSTQVTNAADALAGAIERARQGATVGAIFTEPVAAVIKHRIADAVSSGRLQAVLADIDDDGKPSASPTVHLRLPVSAQMATMPSALLKVLPSLPKELEYRIVGRYLVLRDVDASIVLDYIPSAVPR